MSDNNSDTDSGGEAGKTATDTGDRVDAETQTVPKSEFDELQERFKKINTSSKTQKARLAELEAQVAKLQQTPDPDADPDDKGGDEKGGDGKGDDKSASKSQVDVTKWREKYFTQKEEFAKQLAAKDKEIESIRGEKREFKKDRLLSDLVSTSAARKTSQSLVAKLIREEFELIEGGSDDGGDALEPRDGSAMTAAKWLDRWLDEIDDGGFKENKRAAGTTDDGAGVTRSQQRRAGQQITPQMLQSMDRKERIKTLSENPELRDKLAGQKVDRNR